MRWSVSWRADPRAAALADRHYSRQSPGSPQFVPPGACFVLGIDDRAAWVTSWPLAAYVKHAWAGAWVNTLFRNEGADRASELILEAVAATRHHWPDVPELGMVTMVDPAHVRPTMRRGAPVFGFCYLMAGFEHVGFTKELGQWVWQLKPHRMPPPAPARGAALELFA